MVLATILQLRARTYAERINRAREIEAELAVLTGGARDLRSVKSPKRRAEARRLMREWTRLVREHWRS